MSGSGPGEAGALPRRGALAAVDPGRSKWGLARTDAERERIEEALILSPEAAWQRLRTWREGGAVAGVLLGNGTGSAAWRRRLESLGPVLLLEERGTTLAGRRRYWELFPARGWRRLLPRGLRQPPRDWDDVVAQLLLERHLGHTLGRRPEARS